MGILLSEIFNARSIVLNLSGATKEAVFAELADAITAVRPECDQSEMLAALWEREKKMSTGIVPGVAIPHAIYRGINSVVGAIGISKSGIDYGALDNSPVHVVFMLLMGEFVQENHVRVLNQIFTLVQTEAFELIKTAKTPQDIHALLSQIH